MSSTGLIDERLADATPSAKLVYIVLCEDGPLSKAELAEATELSEETVRRVIKTLEGTLAGVECRPDLQNPRQQLVHITTDASTPERRE